MLETLKNGPIEVQHGEWRPGDQLVCVMDSGKARKMLGWQPMVGLQDGVRQLWDWVNANKGLFA